MQNQEFSEEYYKMKYFKYRAKYEQLKEIAESNSRTQTGGNSWIPFGSKPVQQTQQVSTLNPNAVPFVPGQIAGPTEVPGQIVGPAEVPGQIVGPVEVPGQEQPKTSPSMLQRIGMDKDSREKRAADKAATNQAIKNNISTLMNDIKEFVRENLETKNSKKYFKTIGKLEEPCTYKQLIKIVEDVKIDLNIEMPESLKGKTLAEVHQYATEQQTKINDKKKDLTDRIKKQCATTTGGLNSLCKLEEEDDVSTPNSPAQKGGYTLTPDSLDDINTEF